MMRIDSEFVVRSFSYLAEHSDVDDGVRRLGDEHGAPLDVGGVLQLLALPEDDAQDEVGVLRAEGDLQVDAAFVVHGVVLLKDNHRWIEGLNLHTNCCQLTWFM